MTDNKTGKSLLAAAGWAKTSSRWRGIALIGTTLLIFYLLLRQINTSEVRGHLNSIPVSIWVQATLLSLSFPLLSAVRWHLVLRSVGHVIPIHRCLLVVVGVWPLNVISPSKAGDLMKAVGLRRTVEPAVVAGSVIAERTLDLLILAIFALFGGVLLGEPTITLAAAGVLLAVLLGYAVVRLNIPLPVKRAWQPKIDSLLASMRMLLTRRPLLIAALGITIVNWLASMVQTQLLFEGVGASVGLFYVIAALPVVVFAGLIPVTFAGMGTRDSAMVLLFSDVASPAKALTVSLLYTFFGYWLLAIVGLPFIKRALDW